MTLRRSKRMGPQIFTDSLADVSMLLVVFFMVTSVILIGRGIDLAMPDEPPPGESVELRESVDVHVLASGRLVVDGRPMALSGLLPYIDDRLRADPDKPVILRTDPEAPYDAMVQVLDELRQSPEKIGRSLDNLVIPTLREQATFWPAGTSAR